MSVLAEGSLSLAMKEVKLPKKQVETISFPKAEQAKIKKNTEELFRKTFDNNLQTFKSDSLMKTGTNSGGGGGGMTINGQFYTLAEIGIKIEGEEATFDEQSNYYIERFLSHLDRISVLKGKNNTLRKAIFSRDRIYKTASIVDPIAFEKIKKEYGPFIKNFPGEFGLAALTIEKTTYFFPQFKDLPSFYKGLLAIHEAIYSMTWDYKHNKPGVALKDVLRLDLALKDLDNAIGSPWAVEAWKLTYAFYKLFIPELSPSRAEVAAQLYNLQGRDSEFGFGGTLISGTALTGDEPFILKAQSLVGPMIYEIVVGLKVVRQDQKSNVEINPRDWDMVENPETKLRDCFGSNYPTYSPVICIVE